MPSVLAVAAQRSLLCPSRQTRLLNAASQVILDSSSSTERRISLSSLRCPRSGKEPEPYAVEAKEMLRKLIIGKKVDVKPEYKRTWAPEGQPPADRTFATVIYNSDKNVAEALLLEGLATVARHGQAR